MVILRYQVILENESIFQSKSEYKFFSGAYFSRFRRKKNLDNSFTFVSPTFRIWYPEKFEKLCFKRQVPDLGGNLLENTFCFPMRQVVQKGYHAPEFGKKLRDYSYKEFQSSIPYFGNAFAVSKSSKKLYVSKDVLTRSRWVCN